MLKRERNDLEALEAAARAARTAHYVLQLVVAGGSQHSVTAIVNVRRFCDARLRGRYTLQIVSLRESPQLAKELQIFATPTLIRELPLPQRRFIGNMTRIESILLDYEGNSAEKGGIAAGETFPPAG